MIYLAAALAEIAGCFAFWAIFRQNGSPWLAVPGVLSLVLFASLLAKVDAAYSGRAFAAYGGIYIAVSVGWLWAVDGTRPDRWDVFGALLCLTGAAVIVGAPRT